MFSFNLIEFVVIGNETLDDGGDDEDGKSEFNAVVIPPFDELVLTSFCSKFV
jgi:hypothetical protein